MNNKIEYLLILDKPYKLKDVLTPDPEYGDQVIVTKESEPTDFGDFKVYAHTVVQVTNDPDRQLLEEQWAKGAELTKISHSISGGEYSTHVDYFFFSTEAADKHHEEQQTFCKIFADIVEL